MRLAILFVACGVGSLWALLCPNGVRWFPQSACCILSTSDLMVSYWKASHPTMFPSCPRNISCQSASLFVRCGLVSGITFLKVYTEHWESPSLSIHQAMLSLISCPASSIRIPPDTINVVSDCCQPYRAMSAAMRTDNHTDNFADVVDYFSDVCLRALWIFCWPRLQTTAYALSQHTVHGWWVYQCALWRRHHAGSGPRRWVITHVASVYGWRGTFCVSVMFLHTGAVCMYV